MSENSTSGDKESLSSPESSKTNDPKKAPKKDNDQHLDKELIWLSMKRLGYMPGTLLLLGFTVAILKRWLDAKEAVAHWMDLAAASLVATSILLWAVKLFSKLFAKRPARGLIDGLLAGTIAGLVGGYFGYGWVDWWAYPDSEFAPLEPGMIDGRPNWVRILIAFVFTVPIAGLIGLACDLIHADRKVNWWKHFSKVALVAVGFLALTALTIMKFSPVVQTRGITFSEWLILFELFMLIYPGLVAISFRWKPKKILSRYIWILVAILVTRTGTFFWQTTDEESLLWAKTIGRAAEDAEHITMWERQSCADTYGQDQFNVAIGVVGFCIWSFLVYSLFYFNHPLAVALDKKLAPNIGVKPTKKRTVSRKTKKKRVIKRNTIKTGSGNQQVGG